MQAIDSSLKYITSSTLAIGAVQDTEHVYEQTCTLRKTPGLLSSNQPEQAGREFKLFPSQFPQMTMTPSKTPFPPVLFKNLSLFIYLTFTFNLTKVTDTARTYQRGKIKSFIA